MTGRGRPSAMTTNEARANRQSQGYRATRRWPMQSGGVLHHTRRRSSTIFALHFFSPERSFAMNAQDNRSGQPGSTGSQQGAGSQPGGQAQQYAPGSGQQGGQQTPSSGQQGSQQEAYGPGAGQPGGSV